MLQVIVCRNGQSEALNFLPTERAAAEAVAKANRSKVIELGTLVGFQPNLLSSLKFKKG